MDRRAANTLRLLGIIATVLFVLAACLAILYIALFILLRGGLTERARITHPQAANSFFVAIMLAVALITIGIIVIGRLATGIARGRNASQVPATTPASAAAAPPTAAPTIPSPASRTRQLHLSPAARKTIDRLVLALGAQIAVTAITVFQRASGPLVAPGWTLMLVAPFILFELPDAILIYLLLKRPGRGVFTFLIATLVFPVLQAFFNPLVFIPYRQIFLNPSMGSVWLVFSVLIYVVSVMLAYQAIQQTGLHPRPAPVILATVATSVYFFLARAVTPYLYSVWR
jgi:hypothetical protein